MASCQNVPWGHEEGKEEKPCKGSVVSTCELDYLQYITYEMKLLPGRSHSVCVRDRCKYSLSLTLHQREKMYFYSSRLDRHECSSNIFHASQTWC